MEDPRAGHEPPSHAEHVVIVGGNSGVGAAVRARLEADGVRVVCMHRRAEDPFDAVEGNEPPSIDEPITGLLYCPGSLRLAPIERLSIDDFRHDFEVNLIGAVRVLQSYRKQLLQSSRASVVLFSTVAVQTGMPFHASIAAAKGAIEGLARCLAAEWAPKIRVNVVAPSLTETPLASRLLRTDRQRIAAAERHPMKRVGQPEDVAAMVRFLLSAESSWITGQVLPVDGGMSSLKQF